MSNIFKTSIISKKTNKKLNRINKYLRVEIDRLIEETNLILNSFS